MDFFLGFNLQMPNTELGQDPQAKSRPYERHKSQFIFEYICIKLVTQVKKKLKKLNSDFLLGSF